MDGVIGEIRIFAGNFAPGSWQFCSGQTLPISQYTALFSILGTTYGGNGTTNFCLPNFNGKVVMGAGQGNGLTDRLIGDTGGAPTNTLTISSMPPHIHSAQGTFNQPASSGGGQNTPENNFPGTDPVGSSAYASGASNIQMGQSQVTVTLSPTGTNTVQAIGNVQPYLGLNYIICLSGVFPDRP